MNDLSWTKTSPSTCESDHSCTSVLDRMLEGTSCPDTADHTVTVVEHDTSTSARSQTGLVHTGFVPGNENLHRAYNLVVGLTLLALALPLLILISMALLFTQGPRIFHFGERLGRNKKPFHIVKFRTLDRVAAQELTKDKVLPKNSGIETPLGRYLRASRLDELPQLLNIVRGDMNICGPRPVRRALAEIESPKNPNYDVRFRVKPGLVGHAQAFMNHGASKRLRAKYNYMLCQSPVVYHRELVLFMRVGVSVIANTFIELLRRILPGNAAKDAKRCAERWRLGLVDPETGEEIKVLAFFHDCLVVPRGDVAPVADQHAALSIKVNPAGVRKARLTLQELGPVDGGLAFHYTPETTCSRYLIERYLFGDAVVRPRPRPRAFTKPDRQLFYRSSDWDHVPIK